MTKNTSIPESQQLQLGNPRDASNLMEVEVTICDTCGAQGKERDLAICHKCPDGAQHIYCMRVMLDKVPDGEWTCEECSLTAGTEKLVQDEVKDHSLRTKIHLPEASLNPESSKALKSEVRSSRARRTGENCTSAFACLSDTRHEVPSESQTVKKARASESNAASSRPSKPYQYSPPHEDSCEKSKKKKQKSINELVYSVPQRSTTYLKKAEVPHAFGDREHVSSFTKSIETQRLPETSVISSNCLPLKRKTPSKELRKPKLLATGSCIVALPAQKSGKDTIPSGKTLFSGSCFCNSDAVESALILQDLRTHKEPNFLKEKKKNESQQADHPIKAATDITVNKICTGSASDESSFDRDLARVEAAFLSQGFVFPKFHCSWLGKFLIPSNVGIARTCEGIQAHLSSHASPLVPDVVVRLPEIIILEKLPRLRIWPCQFMGSQVTEEKIGVYFFAKDLVSYETYYKRLMDHMVANDLALKANLNGVQLLIFPSSILPEKSQRWNQMLFFWGIFIGKVASNSANSLMTNSLELGNADNVKSLPFDHNSYLQEGDDMVSPSEAELEAADAILAFAEACTENVAALLCSSVITPVK